MLGHCSWKRNRRSILLLSQTASVCCFLFLLINAFRNKNQKLKTTTERNEITHYETVAFVKNSTESESPICTGNLLSGREYNYAKWARGSHDNRLESTTGSCRLLYYTAERIVSCLDSFRDHKHFDIPHQQYLKNISKTQQNNLHFVFIGDSRIRQQFFNFVKLIPDYDKKSQPSPIPFMHHGDIEVTSNILKLRVSFQWRPVINVTVTETIRRWTISGPNNERPDFILLSMALHHMIHINSVEDYKRLYQEKVIEFAPILDQLGKVSQVIWLNQHPTMDLKKPTSEMVHKYNKDNRHIFENHHNIHIWDSSIPLVEEYIRSCFILERKNSESFWEALDYSTPYINCYDNVHPGYLVLSQATQLLYNNIFNN